MRKIALVLMAVAFVFTVSSCGSTKEVSSSPVKTFSQPGADLVSGNGLIRGWGMGKADNEAVAHRKALMEASAALARALELTYDSTEKEYMDDVSQGNSSRSMTILGGKQEARISRVLNGAVIIFDRWAEKTEDGQYTNYIVMELKGEDFLEELYKEAEKNDVELDKKLLRELLLKQIDEAGKLE